VKIQRDRFKMQNMMLNFVLVMLAINNSYAAESDSGAAHKMVIQVSTDDPRTQNIALNNAVNLQKELGMDNVQIEIVAYGPGLGLLTKQNEQADRVKSLSQQDIKFSACGNTMKKVEKKTGKKSQLTEGVGVVKAGVRRILELQEQGYAYLRP